MLKAAWRRLRRPRMRSSGALELRSSALIRLRGTSPFRSRQCDCLEGFCANGDGHP